MNGITGGKIVVGAGGSESCGRKGGCGGGRDGRGVQIRQG